MFPGSSGSPVLVLDEGTFSTRAGVTFGGRAYFLGLISDAYFEVEEGEVKFKQIPSQVVPTYKQKQFVNLGLVIKAKAVLNTITKFLKAHPVPQSSVTPANPK
ncbi:MAG TPA: hypothetical protein VGQ95_05825 [Chthoniobacterales bacterium]|nr:hypothetical protein [Chthoniobacterales bacterium]